MCINLSQTRWEKSLFAAIKLLAVSSALYGSVLPVQALDIYRWTDEMGKVHISDTVPEKYRSVAKLVNYSKGNTSDAPQQNSGAKVANTKRPPAPDQDADASQATAIGARKPAQATQPLSCNQKWDEYYRSQECFAQYMVRNGMGGSFIRPEAYQNCQEVKTPTMECEYDKRQSKP